MKWQFQKKNNADVAGPPCLRSSRPQFSGSWTQSPRVGTLATPALQEKPELSAALGEGRRFEAE